MKRRCDVNRNFWLGFDCVPSFSSGEVFSKRARFSQGRANASRRVTLTGSLPVCMLFRKNKGQAARQNNRARKEASCHDREMATMCSFGLLTTGIHGLTSLVSCRYEMFLEWYRGRKPMTACCAERSRPKSSQGCQYQKYCMVFSSGLHAFFYS